MGGCTFCRRFDQFLLQILVTWVGDFEVATSGGFWVAVRAWVVITENELDCIKKNQMALKGS
jgi:hypothetical protein